MKIAQWYMKTNFLPVYLVASDHGLQSITWEKKPITLLKSLDGSEPVVKILAQASRQLKEYFDGQRKRFDLPFDVTGTDFQKSVWAALSKIPFGKTVSYADIALQIKNPKAVRAVGSANGKNPIPIIVPCHRVIASDGTLGGYSGGLHIKTRLLKLEGVS